MAQTTVNPYEEIGGYIQTGLAAILLATTIGSNANTYWKALPAGWNTYYPPSPENYMDIPYYVEAAMNGALAGYGATPAGMIEPSVNFVTNKMVSALIGALTVTAGKVIFQWIPRIQKPLTINSQTIVNLNKLKEIGIAAAETPPICIQAPTQGGCLSTPFMGCSCGVCSAQCASNNGHPCIAYGQNGGMTYNM